MENRLITDLKRETVEIDGTEIWFVSYDDLIIEKQGSGRLKDIIDIEQLKIRKSEKE